MAVELAMKFATRINSFLNHGFDLHGSLEAIARTRTDAAVDFNFPEHLETLGEAETARLLNGLGLTLNGMAVRYRTNYIAGEFSNSKNYGNALDLARRTIDAIGRLGGSVLTLWLSYDGNDYRFQDDYARSWERILEAFGTIADYAHPLRLSLEFKPYEPRAHSLLPGTGHTLHLIDELNRDNVGITLDFCHMLMAGENPSFGLALVARKKRLFGIHLNDGYGRTDDGLMFGSVDPARAAEFLFYLKRYTYDGVIYFDTFPIREDPVDEFATNIRTIERISQKLDAYGLDRIREVIDSRDGIRSQQLLQELFY